MSISSLAMTLDQVEERFDLARGKNQRCPLQSFFIALLLKTVLLMCLFTGTNPIPQPLLLRRPWTTMVTLLLGLKIDWCCETSQREC